jgi:hypothetical protein
MPRSQELSAQGGQHTLRGARRQAQGTAQGSPTRISGNFVEEDKYVYGITCLPQGKYLLEARPKMPKVYGFGGRIFCADESGEVACDLKWNR